MIKPLMFLRPLKIKKPFFSLVNTFELDVFVICLIMYIDQLKVFYTKQL